MQGLTGVVQFQAFPGMTGTIYFNQEQLRTLLGTTGVTGHNERRFSERGEHDERCYGVTGSTGSTGSTGVTHYYFGSTGSTGSTGHRYVNVNYTVNANTNGKVVTEITF